MANSLHGKVALITGASQGIGRACALKLAGCGATLALVARNQKKLEEVAQEIGPHAHVFAADMADESQIKSACNGRGLPCLLLLMLPSNPW